MTGNKLFALIEDDYNSVSTASFMDTENLVAPPLDTLVVLIEFTDLLCYFYYVFSNLLL